MDIEIRKLVPGLAEAYARFFDTTPHWDNAVRDELPCYCVTWRNDDTYDAKNTHWYPTREERRERAVQFVKDGKMQGYLAYGDGKIVGWCNATADCQGGVNYMRDYCPIEKYNVDIKVKSIFCFVIAPEMRRRGVATRLVEHVCQEAAADGFDFVEAYPRVEYAALDHMGPLTMYEKMGFQKSAEQEGRVVVRKALR